VYDDEALHDDESAGAGPNEAMYVNVDPIPKSLMLTFEEAIQRQKEILDKSSKVNAYVMPVWDSRKHTKHKFYKADDMQSGETAAMFEALSPAVSYSLKRIPDIAENPVIVKGKLKPSKVVMGKLKSSMSLACAIISICNYDSQFDKSTVGSLIFPNKDD
jgi:tRNA G37 N-methylase TrmD